MQFSITFAIIVHRPLPSLSVTRFPSEFTPEKIMVFLSTPPGELVPIHR